MSKIWHSTSPENLRKIHKSGHFRKGSYVTANPIKKMTSSQGKETLCLLDDRKAKRVCECDIDLSELKVPSEGAWTCSGYSQFQLTENLSVDNCSCNFGRGKKIAAGVLIGSAVLGGILCYIHRRKTVKRKRLHKRNINFQFKQPPNPLNPLIKKFYTPNPYTY